jgi:hypothetical protein
MCSNPNALDRLCEAIEELAAHPAIRSGAATERQDDIAARLAQAWAMVAAADPELAKRLPGYMSATE